MNTHPDTLLTLIVPAALEASVADLLLRPAWRFVKAYVVGGAVFDGRFGLVTSLLGAQTAFLKYSHLYALEAEERRKKSEGRT